MNIMIQIYNHITGCSVHTVGSKSHACVPAYTLVAPTIHIIPIQGSIHRCNNELALTGDVGRIVYPPQPIDKRPIMSEIRRIPNAKSRIPTACYILVHLRHVHNTFYYVTVGSGVFVAAWKRLQRSAMGADEGEWTEAH